jgi:hypothetical protein
MHLSGYGTAVNKGFYIPEFWASCAGRLQWVAVDRYVPYCKSWV